MHGGLDAAHAGAVVVQFLDRRGAFARQGFGARQAPARGVQLALALRHHGLGRQLVAFALRGLGGGAGHAVDRALLLGHGLGALGQQGIDLHARQRLAGGDKVAFLTSTSCTRPGSLAATSISVASMRPLPLMKPSPGPWSPSRRQPR